MSAVDRQPYKITWHDYDGFGGCFGDTKIMPADIDFIVERHGYFLVMEFKEENKNVFLGQDITLKKLSKIPKFTVVVLYHKPREKCDLCESTHDIPIFVSMQLYHNGNAGSIIKKDNSDIIKFVSGWYDTIRQ